MSAVERRSLADCEAVIEKGLGTFIDVGRALLEIRREGLYRLSHGTFEDYCRDRWAFEDSRARQLISAVETVDQLATVTNVTVEEITA